MKNIKERDNWREKILEFSKDLANPRIRGATINIEGRTSWLNIWVSWQIFDERAIWHMQTDRKSSCFHVADSIEEGVRMKEELMGFYYSIRKDLLKEIKKNSLNQ